MRVFTRANLQFALTTFVAAMLALYLAMSIDLPRPYWAMMTVYIVSHPLAAAVRSKAIYRFLGTLLGAAGAVLLIPALVQAPVLLSLAMALWVGACLAISMRDRSPRSYTLMLAGYSIALIGFPAVTHPTDIFDLAVARVQEILLGITCATLVHSLWFPRPVGEALRGRLANWLDEADRWALDVLRGGDPLQLDRDRGRLAAAASEIQLMAVHLPFDTSNLRETTSVVRLLRDRLLLLVPLVSSLSDRLSGLRQTVPELDAQTRQALGAVEAWIGAGAGYADGQSLLARLEGQRAALATRDWSDLERQSLFARLIDLVQALASGRALLAHLYAPDQPLPGPLVGQAALTTDRPLHRDPGLALLSGLSAVIAITITCLVWIGAGWQEGDSAAMTAAITCCLFAALDDPVPAIRKFGNYLVVAMVLAAVYLFVLMPAIGSFPMLMLVFAPMLLGIGVMIPDPQLSFPAVSTILNVVNTLVIQDHTDADFARFLNISLSQFFGVFVAVFVTRTLRSMNAEASARRLLAHTWDHLARLAQGWERETPVDLASQLVDRLGLLMPKLAGARGRDLGGLDILRDVRVGMDLVALRELQPVLPRGTAAGLDRLLSGVGARYQALALGERAPDDPALLPLLDRLLRHLAGRRPPAVRGRGVCALVGLRRNLFPDGPAFPVRVPEART